jgi:hypothetical protein
MRNSLINDQFPSTILLLKFLLLFTFLTLNAINWYKIRTCQTLMDQFRFFFLKRWGRCEGWKSIKIRSVHTYASIIGVFCWSNSGQEAHPILDVKRTDLFVWGGHSEFPFGATFEKDTYVGSQPSERGTHRCASACLTSCQAVGSRFVLLLLSL